MIRPTTIQNKSQKTSLLPRRTLRILSRGSYTVVHRKLTPSRRVDWSLQISKHMISRLEKLKEISLTIIITRKISHWETIPFDEKDYGKTREPEFWPDTILVWDWSVRNNTSCA